MTFRVPTITSLLPRSLRPFAVLLAAATVHLTIGTFYCIGNLVPYMASYLRFAKHRDVQIAQLGWFGGLTQAAIGTFMFVGGLIEAKMGSRFAIFVGCFVATSGVAATSFAIESGIAASAVTYGLVFGAGIGLAYAPCIACAMRWLPNRRGLVSGCVVSGFGLGAFVFNYVATFYVNPANLDPEKNVDGVLYFDQAGILDRTPKVFLVLAGCYGALQIIALSFLTDPFDDEEPLISPDAESVKSDDTSDTQTPDNQEETGMSPLQMIKTQTFYFIYVIFMIGTLLSVFYGTYYKVFGETFIADDHFLSSTGAVGSIANSVGRVFWGHLGDKSSYQVAMSLVTGILAACLFTMSASSFGGKAMYFIWTVSTYLAFSGLFSLSPMVTANVFGRKHFATNYGVVNTAVIVSGLVSSFAASELLQFLHFNWIFFVLGGLACVAFVLALTINFTDRGKPAKL